MLRTTSTRPAAVALAIAATTALTGCGMLGGEESKDASGSPSTPAATSKASSTPKSTSQSTESEANEGKPSKAEVSDGLKKFYDRTDSTNSYDHDKLATCVADRGYDSFSNRTLNALKDGDPSKVEREDRAKYSAVTLACATEGLPSGSLPSMPSIPSLPSELPTGLPSGLPT